MTKQVKKRKENSFENIEKKSKLEKGIVTPPQSDTSSTIEKDSGAVHENLNVEDSSLNVKEDSGSDFEDDSELSDEEEDMFENIQAGKTFYQELSSLKDSCCSVEMVRSCTSFSCCCSNIVLDVLININTFMSRRRFNRFRQ